MQEDNGVLLLLALKRGFQPASSHSQYISNAYKADADPSFKYNFYLPSRIEENSEYGVGDIVFFGRDDESNTIKTKNWTYDDFAKAEPGYPSHGDVVSEVGTDDKGEYIVVAGGNIGNSFKTKKIYKKDIGNTYKAHLKINPKIKSGATIVDGTSVDSFPDYLVKNPGDLEISKFLSGTDKRLMGQLTNFDKHDILNKMSYQGLSGTQIRQEILAKLADPNEKLLSTPMPRKSSKNAKFGRGSRFGHGILFK
jgi:hypothetical protein